MVGVAVGAALVGEAEGAKVSPFAVGDALIGTCVGAVEVGIAVVGAAVGVPVCWSRLLRVTWPVPKYFSQYTATEAMLPLHRV